MQTSIVLVATFGFLVLGVSGAFQYVGVNEAVADFGSAIPGTDGHDYTWPATSSIDYFVSNGMNIFRVPFKWERIQGTLNGPLETVYTASLDTTVSYITKTKGAFALLDVHNYARYNNVAMGSGLDYSAFANLWTQLANRYKNNSKVVFGLMNEPNSMPTQNVFTGMQAAINAIRATGASNLILVPGNSWTGVHSWLASDVNNGAIMVNINDPGNNMMFEMHQYFDKDYSGTGSCVSTFDVEAIFGPATDWLRSNNKIGFLGEFGIEKTPQCLAVLQKTMAYLEANSDVWVGWTWWAAGPWWGNYQFSLEKGVGDAQLAVLKSFTNAADATVPVVSVPPVSSVPPTPSTTASTTSRPVPVTTAQPTPVTTPRPVAATTAQQTPATTSRPVPVTTAQQTPVTTSRPVAATTAASHSTTGSASSPSSPPSAATGPCSILGNMVCTGASTYQTCTQARVGNEWSRTQQCPAGRSCSPAGNWIYCL